MDSKAVLLRHLRRLRFERLAQVARRALQIVLMQQRSPEIARAEHVPVVVPEQRRDVGAGIGDPEIARVDAEDHRRAGGDEVFEKELALLGACTLAALARVAQGAFDRRTEPRQALLQHVIGRAGLEPLHGRFFTQRTGHENERQIRGALDRQSQCGVAVEGWQPIVGQDHVAAAIVQRGEEGVARIDGDNLARDALDAEGLGDEVTIDAIVLDVEHAQRRPIRHATVLPFAAAAVR